MVVGLVGKDKANAGCDKGAASPVSAPPISDYKRRAPLAGRSYKDSHTQQSITS
ncbi:hypothetical protein KKE26_11395 [bacterium]|nr:hypothetical protein [bacterium]